MPKVTYFPGLNALRFFSAAAVLVTHIELYKALLNVPSSVYLNPAVFYAGGMGVDFFFVLSGFLITYLLLLEIGKSGKVDFKAFFMRRLLRIFPLYYLLIVFGVILNLKFEYFSLGGYTTDFMANIGENIWLYFTMLPNVALSVYRPIPHIGQVWSIGVEEQFYLTWPLIIPFLYKGNRLWYLLFAIIGIKVALVLFADQLPLSITGREYLFKYLAMSRFELMVAGGILAKMIFDNQISERVARLTRSKILFALLIACVLALPYLMPESIIDGIHLIYGILFVGILACIVVNRQIGESLDRVKFLNYFGKISYGIYMYQMIIVFVVVKFFSALFNYGSDNALLFNFYVYSVSVILTLAISALSYEYFEKGFLRLKNKHQRV
ncbi:MAG: acyltransferase family protein [Luteibaculum sp.]